MVTPVTAPNAQTYASRIPYLTVAEFLASATGVDTTNLIDGGTPNQQKDALKQVIARASSMVDNHCMKVLAATRDIQAGWYRIRREGTIKVPLDITPIIQVTGVQVGFLANQLYTLTDLSGATIAKKVVEIPLGYSPNVRTGFGGRVYAIVTYVNGFANALTTTTTIGGGTTLTLDSVLGIVAGMPLTVYDPGTTEQVFVQAITGNTLTLAAPLQFDHASGVAVSALPPVVKQACALFAAGIIKTRGDDAFMMPQLGAQPSQQQSSSGHMQDDFSEAELLLKPYRRVS